MTPNKLVVGAVTTFTNKIIFSTNAFDSGIGEIVVKKPAGFGVWIPSTVIAMTNGVSYMTVTSGSNVSVGQVLVSTNGDEMKVRFLQSPGNAGALTRDGINISIVFQLTAPLVADLNGLEFKTYADCVKYDYTGYDRWATTGRKRAYPSGTLLMSCYVYNQPSAVASISPSSLYEGTSDFDFSYFISTSNNSQGPDISRALIKVPDGFVVDSVSSILTTSNYFTNGNDIIIDYDKAGSFLPSENGIEFININISGTPMSMFTKWTSYVYSVLPGSIPQKTGTNTVYKSQGVTVLPEKPKVNAWVSPNRLYDVSVSNTISFFLENTKVAGITNAVIYLPDVFTNARIISSLFLATNFISYDSSSNCFRIRYGEGGTNIPYNCSDEIKMMVFDDVQSGTLTNVSLTATVDNGNGDGLLPAQEGVIGLSIDFQPPLADGMASVKTNSIFSTDVTNSFTYQLYNSAVMDGNDLFMVRIKMPSSITNVTQISSSKMFDESSFAKFSNGCVYLRYFKDPNGKLLRNQLDTISFRVYDAFSSVTSFTMESFVANSSNTNSFQKTGNYLTGNKIVNVVHPLVSAQSFIRPSNVDSTFDTNSFNLYLVNKGEQENFIRTARVNFPLAQVTNLTLIDSSIIANDWANAVFDKGTGILTLDYLADGHLLPTSQTDVISFLMADSVTKNDLASIVVFASNILESVSLIPPTGESLDVTFALPPPDVLCSIHPNVLFTTVSARTDKIVLKVTNRGKGSNNLKKVKMALPSALQNKVTAVSNEYLPGTTILTWTATDIFVDYTNGNLPGGGTDLVDVYFENTVNKVGSNVSFIAYADNDNGSGFVQSSTNDSFSRKLTFNKQPDISIQPARVQLTSFSNDFTMTIRNGAFSPAAKSIFRIKIPIPNPVFVSNGLRLLGNVWYPAQTTLSKEQGSIIITYGAANYLTPGASDQITFNAKDVRLYGETNMPWTAQVDFNDGSGWKDATVLLGNTNAVQLELPIPTATAKGSPTSIGTDNEMIPMSITISNTGLLGSDLKMAKIIPPSEITNLGNVSSAILGAISSFSNHVLSLGYYLSNTNIKAGAVDVITFDAYDRVTNAYSGAWTVFIANKPDTNNFELASPQSGGALAINYFVPTYNAGYYLSPNIVDTSISTTTFTNVIANTGTGSNNINAAYIDFPAGLFITNGMIINSDKALNWSYQTNSLLFNYNPANFVPGQQDVIRITLQDTFEAGDMASSFQARVRFDTSAGKFVKSSVPTGKSRSVGFVMPAPDMDISVLNSEIYNTAPTGTVKVNVVNKGKGSNKIVSAKVYVPSIFTNSLSCLSLLAVSNVRFDGGYIAYYTNFASSMTDSLVFSFQKPGNSLYPATNWNILADNGSLTSWAVGVNKAVSVESVPSFHVDPIDMFSTTPTNTLLVKIFNNGTGNSTIKNALVTLPTVMTNVVSLESSWINNDAVNIVRNGASVVLSYSNDVAGSIMDAESDILTVRFISVKKETNVSISCSVNNGAGAGNATLFSGKTNEVSFALPANPGVGWLKTSMVYNTVKTNTLTYAIKNQGSGNNELLRARINFSAAGFVSLDNIESSKMSNDVSIITNAGYIEIDYSSDSAGPLRAGEIDNITFRAVHNIDNGVETTRSLPSQTDNGRGWEVVGPPVVPSDAVQTLRFVSPEDSSVFWIEGNNVFFTLDTNGSFLLNVGNNSYKNGIEKIRFSFPLDVYSVGSVDSDLIVNDASSVFYDTVSNRITVDYSIDDNPLPLRSEDSIKFDVTYHRSSNVPWPISLEIQYRGAPTFENAAIRVFRTNVLHIKKVGWGRIAGSVLPQNVPTTVKVYYAGTKTLVPTAITDVPPVSINDSISASSDPSMGNQYVLGFIPPGTYDLEFSATKFYTSTYNTVQIVVNPNMVTELPPITLMNAPVNANSLVKQEVYCNEPPYDIKPFMEIPIGTLLNDYIPEVKTNHLTPSQILDLSKNNYVLNPVQTEALISFDVKMFNLKIADEYQYGVRMASPITLNVPYNPVAIAAQGWSESSLAVYYWDETAGKWYKVGGKVDSSGHFVTVQVDFLARTYAVFGDSPHKDGEIYDVVIKNNPFTPGNLASGFEFVTVSFSLLNPNSEVSILIFNMKGELIRKYLLDCPNGQGTFSWDGLDFDGYPLPAGIYIYQIRAGKDKYTGTVLLAK